MITIKNLRNNTPLEENDYYCGRHCFHRPELQESPLANPFSKSPREENVKAYEVWLRKRLESPNSPASLEIDMLVQWAAERDLGLCCWCALPGKSILCHSDIIQKIILEKLDN